MDPDKLNELDLSAEDESDEVDSDFSEFLKSEEFNRMVEDISIGLENFEFENKIFNVDHIKMIDKYDSKLAQLFSSNKLDGRSLSVITMVDYHGSANYPSKNLFFVDMALEDIYDLINKGEEEFRV